jgi:UDP-N-acetylmuramyl pentapeptide phosphotransferase/UDP-N-acetylglucosamine-1-phosphate transferase
MMPLVALIAVLIVICPPLLILVRRNADRLGLLDHPNERSSHARPTPRGGGISIVAGTLLATAVYLWLTGAPVRGPWTAAALAALGVAGVSLVDDRRSLPALLRLSTHLIASVLVVLTIAIPESGDWPLVGRVSVGGAARPLAVLWIVGLTNVYNFMDGIDGLAGIQGLVAGAAWAALGWQVDSPLGMGLGLACAGSSLIFLLFNWAPASIFMGDTGSAFLGFIFALLPFVTRLTTDPALGSGQERLFVAGILALWPFVFDASLTLIRRVVRGENMLTPHRQHLYQSLVRSGLSHGQVSSLYGGMALAGACVGLAWTAHAVPDLVAAVSPVVLAALMWSITARRERRGVRAQGESA